MPMKLSLAITTYLRYEMTIESFAQIIDDPRIDDIVILDDCSTDGSFEKLVEYFKDNSKVRVIRQAQNRGMLVNKFHAVGYAKNDWVILLDSDNKIDESYIDSFYKAHDTIIKQHGEPLYPGAIFAPEFARPAFNYRKFSGKSFNRWNITELTSDQMGNCLLNTCNYIVYKYFYTKVFEDNVEMKRTDTLWFNYLWLKAGNSFYVVPGMQYDHLVHDGSTWKEHADYNMKMADTINKKILAL
jgi:glycosyltransferase involved in cell wall biosynthesis